MKKRLLIILFFIVSILGCNLTKKEMPVEKFSREKISYEGDPSKKSESIDFVDKALRKHGNFDVYGDLSGGLEELSKDMRIKIIDKDIYYSIDIYPSSGVGGHDFSFKIDKETGQISDVVVGEIEPPPIEE